MMIEIVYLTTNQVIAINTVQIHLYSPKEQIGIKDPGLLDSATNRPKQSAFGQDVYPSIYEKAAALFESIAKNHAFHNANKRIALLCLTHYIFENKSLSMDNGNRGRTRFYSRCWKS